MKRNLAFKLILCFLVVFTGSLALLNTAGKKYIYHNIVTEKKDSLYEEAATISEQYLKDLYSNSFSLTNLKAELSALDKCIHAHILLVNNSGEIICDTMSSNGATEGKDLLEDNQDLLNHTFYENLTLKDLIKYPSLAVVYPIPFNYKLRTYLILHIPNSFIEREVVRYTNTGSIFVLIFLVLLILLFVYLYLMTARPLQKIRTAAFEYAKGNFGYKLALKGHDEFHDVSTALTYMSKELSSSDEYQKQFVANISHDFRSPLTSIKGYAEAMMDGTIPVELQPKYLDVIVFETERLNKLTSNLLELSSFDNNKNKLDLSSFDINDIIKKTALSFEGICTKKKIQFDLVFSDKSLFVSADMGKIQQVLYNLIDNAIKFSPVNSQIRISSNRKNDKAFISVKDYGVGIPKASIHKIWERFYKIDSSRGKDKKGTGLGLSITKEIIQAHNENIDVISTPGAGSEFTFSLTLANED